MNTFISFVTFSDDHLICAGLRSAVKVEVEGFEEDKENESGDDYEDDDEEDKYKEKLDEETGLLLGTKFMPIRIKMLLIGFACIVVCRAGARLHFSPLISAFTIHDFFFSY